MSAPFKVRREYPAGRGPDTAFGDASPLRAYLRQRSQDERTSPDGAFEAFISLAEDFDALRYAAENRHKNNPFRAIDKRRELPVSWDDAADLWYLKRDEPPVTIISRIAQDHATLIAGVLAHLRRILRRTRMQVPVSSVSQLDAECLRRFSRLPGDTAEEKAAARRTVLGVVRVESFDTLENRVLKAFLKRCEVEAERYFLKYGKTKAAKESERVKAVGRLRSRFHETLREPVWGTVADLHEMPIPNYVLRQDPLYSKIWGLYRELVDQDRRLERMWPNRDQLFFDAVLIWLRLALFAEARACPTGNPFAPRFGGDPWVRRNAIGGRFLAGSPMRQLGERGGAERLALAELPDGIRLVFTREADQSGGSNLFGRCDTTVRLAYCAGGTMTAHERDGIFWIGREEGVARGIRRTGNAVFVGDGEKPGEFGLGAAVNSLAAILPGGAT